MRVLADHARATAFLIADGVFPSTKGADTCCAASCAARSVTACALGLARGDFMLDSCEQVIDEMSEAYPELDERKTASS